MVADFYERRGSPPEAAAPGIGRVARYARGRDYHDVLKRRLRDVCDRVRATWPGAATRAFADTAPVPERELAAMCGLGWVGKHTLLIHPERGSWMVLGGFLTTLALEPAGASTPEPDRCGSCTRCIDACPTKAITPYSVDARRCISYLTIEHHAPIAPALGERMGDWIVGCDVCQEVCPHNSPRAERAAGAPMRDEYAARRRGFDLLAVLGWDESERRARFATSAMKRITLAQMKRNAMLAAVREVEAGGSGRERLLARLTDLAWCAGEPPSVRAAAREAVERLSRPGGSTAGPGAR
jgi:epoxyqueuosine reductase